MFRPEDPLAPRGPVFDEAWQAQTLAMADTLIAAGRLKATDWAQGLGDELARAEAEGRPDTSETYYLCALAALERLMHDSRAVTAAEMAARKAAWVAAYERTPHGKPVEL